MSSILKIMPISHQQSFLLARNHYNWAWPTTENPYQYYPPFVSPNIIGKSLVVSEFKIRPITIKGTQKVVDSDGTETMNVGLIKWEVGDNRLMFYYRAKARISTSLETGLHEYYILLDNGKEYISEPFWLIVNCNPVSTVGDYSDSTTAPAGTHDDWNQDWFK